MKFTRETGSWLSIHRIRTFVRQICGVDELGAGLWGRISLSHLRHGFRNGFAARLQLLQDLQNYVINAEHVASF